MASERPTLKGETLDFIYEHTKDAADLQLRDADALHGKLVQIVSVGSVLIGLTGFAGRDAPRDASLLVALGTALVAYVVIAFLAIVGLMGRQYRRSTQADQLWPRYWDDPVEDIKHALVADIAGAYAHNKEVLDQQHVLTAGTLVALMVEVAAVGAFIFRSLWLGA